MARQRRAPAAPPAAAPAAFQPLFESDLFVQFLDLKERDDTQRAELEDERISLSIRKKEEKELEKSLEDRLVNITKRLARRGEGPAYPVVDLMFGGDKDRKVPGEKSPHPFEKDPPGVREILFSGRQSGGVRVFDHLDGVFITTRDVQHTGLTDPERALAATFGLLELDGMVDPENPRFYQAVHNNRAEYLKYIDLFDNVLHVLIEKGMVRNPAPGLPVPLSQVRADEWAAVVRALIARGIRADDHLLDTYVENELGKSTGGADDEPSGNVEIQLPDLEAQADVDIVANNVKAMQAVYFTAMLDELKLFQVVDKLVELFNSGMLPLGKGTAGFSLYKYWKKNVNRYSELERRNLYARTLGLPGGDASVDAANREFDDLWLRFVSAVSAYVRQFTVDDMLRAKNPIAVSTEQVRKAGRDLAANLSLHGYGIAHFAAVDFQNQLNDAIALLSNPEVKGAYGARDMWQVIDQVASLELGGAKNSVRYRTMANAGAIIIRWLAKHANDLTGAGRRGILSPSAIRNPSALGSGRKALDDPSDRDLVDACEQWLAVTGTQDDSVEEYSQPSVGPNQTSLPIKIPAVARDLLDSVGVRSNGMAAR